MIVNHGQHFTTYMQRYVKISVLCSKCSYEASGKTSVNTVWKETVKVGPWICVCIHRCVLADSRLSCLDISVIVTLVRSIFLLPMHRGRFILFACQKTKVWMIDGPTSTALPPFIKLLVFRIGNSLTHTYTHQYQRSHNQRAYAIFNPMRTRIQRVWLNAVLVKAHLGQQRVKNTAFLFL